MSELSQRQEHVLVELVKYDMHFTAEMACKAWERGEQYELTDYARRRLLANPSLLELYRQANDEARPPAPTLFS